MYMYNKEPGLKVVSLFDGISCGRQALLESGISVSQYFASEIDKNAIRVSSDNHEDIVRIGDVSKVKYEKGTLTSEYGSWYVGKIDLILAGSPCQGFSLAGKQLNFKDPRSKLYFEFTRLLSEIRKFNPDVKFLLENVRMKKEFIDTITDDLDCNPMILNSRAKVAQNRERYYWTNLLCNSEKDSLVETFKNTQGPDIRSIIDMPTEDYSGVWTWPRGYNKGGTKASTKIPCITVSSWQYNFLLENRCGVRRKFKPEECERAQGLPDGYTSSISDNARYKVLGNCWTVPVISAIISGYQGAV